MLVSVVTLKGVSAEAVPGGDYDADDDGFIEISYLEHLDAIRYDLDGDGEADSASGADAYFEAFPGAAPGMGCGNCVGYELTRDLDFKDPASYVSGSVNTKWTGNVGWLPIGIGDNSFNATLDGNGHTIANLFIERFGLSDTGSNGLFGNVGASGNIRSIGLVGIAVRGNRRVGGLAGANEGSISESHASGRVSGSQSVGGLFGAHDTFVGGLVGDNWEAIIASYATASVSGETWVGGLVGINRGTISFSRATGGVSGE